MAAPLRIRRQWRYLESPRKSAFSAVGEASNDVEEPVWWKRLGPVDKCESLGR